MPSTFETNEPTLEELLDDIHKGRIQLPDFQRGWVWDDNHIRDLIASVSQSYPIGAVMFLETGGEGASFKPRLIEGVIVQNPPTPKLLVLDGQQRLTSLYQSLRSGRVVKTRTDKDKEIERVYYLDIVKCLDPDAERLDAVISIPADRVVRSDFGRKIDLDLSTLEKEFEHGYFPLETIYDQDRLMDWRQAFQKHFNFDDMKVRQINQFEAQIIRQFIAYKLPVIELFSTTAKEAVCHVFEKVNTGGVALTVFELVTATFAADNFELRKDWDARSERLRKHSQLRNVEASEFLTAITLLATYHRNLAGQGTVSAKRRDILRLRLDEYLKFADPIERGLVNAAKLLTREKIYDTTSLPYQTQLMPLSAICAYLDAALESDAVKRLLARWFWCGVFGELYGGANEARFANDIQEVIPWLEGGPEPRTIRDSNFAPTRLLTLQSRLSAAYKGLAAQLMQAGSEDFISGDAVELNTYFDTAVDIHHIFPRAYCESVGLPRQKWNSVVNKTPISARTNRILSGKRPGDYLAGIERNHGVPASRLDTILRTHLIDPALLRSDSFDAFIIDRASSLLDLIEKATGKPVAGRDSEEVANAFGAPLVPKASAVV